MEWLPEFAQPAFMQRLLLAALLVGLAAPTVGTYLVQRRLSLIGDGLGHVALAGVSLGYLTGTQPVLTAVVVAVGGAVAIELIRWYGRASADVALALLFYGGIAGGVVLINLSPGGNTGTLTGYLFGSLTTVSAADVTTTAVLTAVVLLVTVGLRRALFAVCQDEEFARVTGVPVRLVNLVLAVTTAITVTLAMRAVGVLLVSALMVVPVAIAQQFARGFAAALASAVGVGVAVALGGSVTSYYADLPSGATIVLLAIALFLLSAIAGGVVRRVRHPAPEREEPAEDDLVVA